MEFISYSIFHRRNPLRNEWYSEYILAPVMRSCCPSF